MYILLLVFWIIYLPNCLAQPENRNDHFIGLSELCLPAEAINVATINGIFTLSFFLSLCVTYISPRRGCPSVPKLCMRPYVTNIDAFHTHTTIFGWTRGGVHSAHNNTQVWRSEVQIAKSITITSFLQARFMSTHI